MTPWSASCVVSNSTVDGSPDKKGAVRPWTYAAPILEGNPVIGTGARDLSPGGSAAAVDPAAGGGELAGGGGVAAGRAAAAAQAGQVLHRGGAGGGEQGEEGVLEDGEAAELRSGLRGRRTERRGAADALVRAGGELVPAALAGERELGLREIRDGGPGGGGAHAWAIWAHAPRSSPSSSPTLSTMAGSLAARASSRWRWQKT